MKKRFTEERIVGFLKEADASMPVAELCRKHGFPMPHIRMESQVRRHGSIRYETA
jgi:hypothetical protein